MPSTTSRNRHWPPRWTRKHGAIYYRTRDDDRHLWDDRSWFRLGATEAEAWATWYARVSGPTTEIATMGDLCDRYAREIIPTLGQKTQRDYQRALIRIRAVFGRMRPDQVRARHVYAYMDRRPPVAANRERAVLSAIMTKAVRWGVVERNLVREVERNEEPSRDRYVSDRELRAFLRHCSPWLRAYVALKMATGVRQGQLLALRRSDWDAAAQALSVPAAKRGRPVIYRGPLVAKAVARIRDRSHGPSSSIWLIAAGHGGRYTTDGFRAIWQRAMAKHVEAGGERFREHDLRAKVGSDEQDLEVARRQLGHQSGATTGRHYRRAPEVVDIRSRRR